MPTSDVAHRLRDAAFALFAEQGYDATTVEAIAERAGVGRTTFFRVFGTKEDVIFPDHAAVLEGARQVGETIGPIDTVVWCAGYWHTFDATDWQAEEFARHVEVNLLGLGHVVDATALAPRASLLRIATGRDAADTAFLTTIGGAATLASLEVSAVVDELPADDATALVRLG